MPRYRLVIEYDGSPYRGWQRQDNVPSIQGALESALSRIGESDRSVQGAGRTDAGVHAFGQVGHVDLIKDWDPFRIMEAMNSQLYDGKEKVAVLSCQSCPDDFHARYSATKRYYLYRLIIRRAPLILEGGKAWNVKRPLDIDAMIQATKVLIGEHDFTTFRSVECQSKSPIKSLDTLDISEKDGVLEITTTARSYLHHQVRSLVGALKAVGEGKWTDADLTSALLAKDRSLCPALAPSCGLYLVGVEYGKEGS